MSNSFEQPVGDPQETPEAQLLSKASIRKYLKSGGCHCPSCGSTDIDADGPEIYEGGASQRVKCHRCGLDWDDKYILAGVYEVARGETIWHTQDDDTIRQLTKALRDVLPYAENESSSLCEHGKNDDGCKDEYKKSERVITKAVKLLARLEESSDLKASTQRSLP